MNNNSTIEELQNKPLLHATLGDLQQLWQATMRKEILNDNSPLPSSGKKVYGIKGIAETLGVSQTTAQRFVSSGKIDGAISRLGKTIVADVDALWAIFKCNQKLKYAHKYGN